MQRVITPQDYIDRLNELAATTSPVNRFFLFLEADLYDMESELTGSTQSEEFYNRLRDQFRTWRHE